MKQIIGLPITTIQKKTIYLIFNTQKFSTYATHINNTIIPQDWQSLITIRLN